MEANASPEGKPLISVVFSFRNEEDVLHELIRRLDAAFDEADVDAEYIFVNDDSTDGSRALLEEYVAQGSRVRLINMANRFGVNPCFHAGIRASKGDAVVTMDTDLQDPPELLPELIAKWREGFDVVYTKRTKRKGETRFKQWVTLQAYRIIKRCSSVDLPTEAGMFRLISRRVADVISQIDEPDPFLRGLTMWAGFRRTEVRYEREARYAGVAHFPLLGTGPAKEFMLGLTSFSVVPLSILIFLGVFVAAGCCLTGLILIAAAVLGAPVSGWVFGCLALGALGGVQLFAMGILGIYIGRIHCQVRARPHYIIESTAGFEKGA